MSMLRPCLQPHRDLGLAKKMAKNYLSAILAELKVARRAEATADQPQHTPHSRQRLMIAQAGETGFSACRALT